MKHLTRKLDQLIYGYDPTQFMPIYRDGEVENKVAFVAYKVGRVVERFTPSISS